VGPLRREGGALLRIRTSWSFMGANATRAESLTFGGLGAPRPTTDFAPPLSAVHPALVPETACRRTYDHRVRELAYHAGDPGVAQRLGVPLSTARSWDTAGNAGRGHSRCHRSIRHSSTIFPWPKNV